MVRGPWGDLTQGRKSSGQSEEIEPDGDLDEHVKPQQVHSPKTPTYTPHMFSGLPSTQSTAESPWTWGGAGWPTGPWYLGPNGFFMPHLLQGTSAPDDAWWNVSLPSPPSNEDGASRSSAGGRLSFDQDQQMKTSLHREQIEDAWNFPGIAKEVAQELREFKLEMKKSSVQLGAEFKQILDRYGTAMQLHEEKIDAMGEFLQPFLTKDDDHGPPPKKDSNEPEPEGKVQMSPRNLGTKDAKGMKSRRPPRSPCGVPRSPEAGPWGVRPLPLHPLTGACGNTLSPQASQQPSRQASEESLGKMKEREIDRRIITRADSGKSANETKKAEVRGISKEKTGACANTLSPQASEESLGKVKERVRVVSKERPAIDWQASVNSKESPAEIRINSREIILEQSRSNSNTSTAGPVSDENSGSKQILKPHPSKIMSSQKSGLSTSPENRDSCLLSQKSSLSVQTESSKSTRAKFLRGMSGGSGIKKLSLDTEAFMDAQDRGVIEVETPKPPWFIVIPTQWKRIAWDLVALIIICFEAVALPLEIGFDMDFHMGWFWFSTIFFGCDIFLNCLTAYISKNGEMIVLPQKIAKHYLYSFWFPLDLISTIPWQLMLADKEATAAVLRRSRTLKIAKILKACRMMRVLRAFRVMRLLAHYQTIVTRRGSRATFRILFTFFSFVYVLHLCACIWALIGQPESDELHPSAMCIPGGPCENGVDGSPWMQRYNQIDKSLEELYVISAYHASAHLVQSMVEITPGNDAERLHVIICQVTNFFLCSFVIGVFLKVMMTYDVRSEEFAHDLNHLRELIVSRGLPLALRIKIERYLEWRQETSKKAVSRYEAFLEHLSPALRGELKHALFGKTLVHHPFFAQMPEQALIEICLVCSTMDAAPGDVVFEEGASMNSMLCVLSGQLKLVGEKESGTTVTMVRRSYAFNEPGMHSEPSTPDRSRRHGISKTGTPSRLSAESLRGHARLVGAGQWVGDLCLFHNNVKLQCKIMAQEYTEILIVTRGNIMQMLEKMPGVQPLYEKLQAFCS